MLDSAPGIEHAKPTAQRASLNKALGQFWQLNLDLAGEEIPSFEFLARLFNLLLFGKFGAAQLNLASRVYLLQGKACAR